MIVPGSCIFQVFTWILPTVHSQSQNAKPATNSPSANALGPSACFLNGDFSEDGCKLETVLCNQLPTECSSYVYAGIRVDLTYNVFNPFDKAIDDYLLKLLQCAKVPVYITYGYESLTQWSLALACNGANGLNVKSEVEGLKAYLDKHKTISGVLLSNLDVVPNQKGFENFSPNFKSYVTSFKQLLPELQFGMLLYADEIQMHYKNPIVPWIDFKEVIDLLDFIVISYSFFNKCGNEFVRGGIQPLTGNAEYTMEKTQGFMEKAGIKKEKLHIKCDLFPVNADSSASYCVNTYPKMCKDPKIAVGWCADNTTSYYDKGVFVKKFASGFVGAAVDMDDVHCDCQCGRSYPAFRAILDGFNGLPMPALCPLFDRC